MRNLLFSLTSSYVILLSSCYSDQVVSKKDTSTKNPDVKEASVNDYAINKSISMDEIFDKIDDIINEGTKYTLNLEYADLRALDSLKIEVSLLVDLLVNSNSVEEIAKVYKSKSRINFNFIHSNDYKIGVLNWNINYANIKIEPYFCVFYMSQDKVQVYKALTNKHTQSQIKEIKSLTIDSKMVYLLSVISIDIFECKQQITTVHFTEEQLEFAELFENNSCTYHVNGNVTFIGNEIVNFEYLCPSKKNLDKSNFQELIFEGGIFKIKK